MQTLQLQDGVIETDELVEGMTNEEISSSVAKLDAGIQTLQKTKERMLRQLTRNTEGDAGDAGPKANMQAPDGEIHINGEDQGWVVPLLALGLMIRIHTWMSGFLEWVEIVSFLSRS